MKDTRLDSGAYWRRCIDDALREGVSEKWSKSVFEGSDRIPRRFLEELSASGSTILDFGCGVGRNALYLARMGHEVLVCDVAEAGVRYCLEKAGEEGLAIRAVGYDGSAIDLPDRAVDAAVAWSCLDHVTLDWASELARELARVARPGAVLLVSFDEDKSDDPESTSEILEDGTHHYVAGRRAGLLFRPYTNAEINALFDDDWECLEWEGLGTTVPRRALFKRRG